VSVDIGEASRLFLEPGIETAPRTTLLAMQQDKLPALLQTISRSAFYRRRFEDSGVGFDSIETLEDFSRRVPTMSKTDLRAFRGATSDPFGGLLCTPIDAIQTVTSSSGTTGDAEFFAESWEPGTCNQLSAGHLRPLFHMGIRPGDLTVGSPTLFRGLLDDAMRLLGATPLLIDSWIGSLAAAVPHMVRHRPSFMQIVSPQVIELERLAPKQDLRDLFSSFKGVAFAGEPLSARRRRRLEHDWGIPLYVYASAGDCGTAWECRVHDGYHVWDDEVITEVIDPVTGAPVPEGTLGELVTTDLDNAAAPLVRYRTGDLVRLDRSPCGCGRTHTRMWVLGRSGDETIVGGRTLAPLDIWDVIESVPGCGQGLFQIIRPQRQVERLMLRVGHDAELAKTSGRNVAELIGNAVEQAIGIRPDVQLETVAEMMARGTGAKIPRVVPQ
jgi:phenylacetate-CoA ligase